jgi:ubiquinone/menaquinone biosynthesis C-methylase UbiE
MNLKLYVNNFAQSVSNSNRERKFYYFMNLFTIEKRTKILDVGASDDEKQAAANILEKRYPYQRNITVLGTQKYNNLVERYPFVKAVQYNGEMFPFKDNSFDICWSNAVLEHVGNNARQVVFLKEIKRCANKAFITTPNKFFPVETHTKLFFIHWLPKKLFDQIARRINLGWATGDYMHLLSLREIKRLLAQAGIQKYRIKKNRFLFFTMDFVIIY